MLLAAYFAIIGAFALAATVDPLLVQLFDTAVSMFFFLCPVFALALINCCAVVLVICPFISSAEIVELKKTEPTNDCTAARLRAMRM